MCGNEIPDSKYLPIVHRLRNQKRYYRHGHSKKLKSTRARTHILLHEKTP